MCLRDAADGKGVLQVYSSGFVDQAAIRKKFSQVVRAFPLIGLPFYRHNTFVKSFHVPANSLQGE